MFQAYADLLVDAIPDLLIGRQGLSRLARLGRILVVPVLIILFGECHVAQLGFGELAGQEHLLQGIFVILFQALDGLDVLFQLFFFVLNGEVRFLQFAGQAFVELGIGIIGLLGRIQDQLLVNEVFQAFLYRLWFIAVDR